MTNTKGIPKATDYPKTPLVTLPSLSWWIVGLNKISTLFSSREYLDLTTNPKQANYLGSTMPTISFLMAHAFG